MRELTGPVLGITLVLTAVFLPASFLPGITGQMFRQFALVIAATAIISAINALTLKPTQCALYLRPRREGPQGRTGSIAASIAVYGAVEARYIGARRAGWCAARSSMALPLHRRRRRSPRRLFAIYPTALDAARRPGILHRHRAASRRRFAAARAPGGGGHRRPAQRTFPASRAG